MRTSISDKEIEAMAQTIQHSENIGTGFLMDDDAVKRIEEAIHIIGIGEGVDWSAKVMKKAVQLQGSKLGLAYYVAIKTKDTIYSGVNVSEDANIIVIKDFNEKLITVEKIDVIEYATTKSLKDLDYQLIGMQGESISEESAEPKKVLLGISPDVKGFEIELVLTDEDGAECYAKKGFNEKYNKSDKREQESMMASVSCEFSEILDNTAKEVQQTKEPTGYYFLSGRTVYKDMPCTVYIHKEPNDENLLSKEEFKKIYSDVPEANSYGVTISFDIFNIDEISIVLKDIELDEPLTITPLLKNQYKSDNYASISAMAYDIRPKQGGMIMGSINNYKLSFCFDEAQENKSLDSHSTSVPF